MEHLPDGERFRYEEGGATESFDMTMIGMHQVRNAAVSIKVAGLLGEHGFRIDPGHVKRGLLKAYWPGRMEKVSIPHRSSWMAPTIQKAWRHSSPQFRSDSEEGVYPVCSPPSRIKT